MQIRIKYENFVAVGISVILKSACTCVLNILSFSCHTDYTGEFCEGKIGDPNEPGNNLMIALICLGVLVGVCFIIIVAIYCVQRNRSHRQL